MAGSKLGRLTAALLALAAQNTNLLFIYLAYFPSIMFWLLDGYFLRQEKLYRALFNQVRLSPEDKIDFSLDTAVVQKLVPGWSQILGAQTIILFHGSIIVSILVVMIATMFFTK